jgi:hypothetical protein
MEEDKRETTLALAQIGQVDPAQAGAPDREGEGIELVHRPPSLGWLRGPACTSPGLD